MKTKLSFISKITIIALLTFYGCKKYEDGPAFTLASKKSRLANTWTYEKCFDPQTGNDFTANFAGMTLEINRDKTYLELDNSTNGNYSTKGTWELDNDKKYLILTEANASDGDSYEIKRLTRNELWLGFRGVEYQLKGK